MSAEKHPSKPGIYLKDRVLHVIGPRYIAMVSSALASETRARILEYIANRPADLDEISKVVGQSKANVSSQIRKLENVNIVRARYEPGSRGIKKVVELNVDKIVFHVALKKERD